MYGRSFHQATRNTVKPQTKLKCTRSSVAKKWDEKQADIVLRWSAFQLHWQICNTADPGGIQFASYRVVELSNSDK
jgi:hypothetical protein